MTAPVITCDRHRMATDGVGVTTLVCFHGCPLRCKYCINSFSFAPDTRRTDMTAEELYQKVKDGAPDAPSNYKEFIERLTDNGRTV